MYEHSEKKNADAYVHRSRRPDGRLHSLDNRTRTSCRSTTTTPMTTTTTSPSLLFHWAAAAVATAFSSALLFSSFAERWTMNQHSKILIIFILSKRRAFYVRSRRRLRLRTRFVCACLTWISCGADSIISSMPFSTFLFPLPQHFLMFSFQWNVLLSHFVVHRGTKIAAVDIDFLEFRQRKIKSLSMKNFRLLN